MSSVTFNVAHRRISRQNRFDSGGNTNLRAAKKTKGETSGQESICSYRFCSRVDRAESPFLECLEFSNHLLPGDRYQRSPDVDQVNIVADEANRRIGHR